MCVAGSGGQGAPAGACSQGFSSTRQRHSWAKGGSCLFFTAPLAFNSFLWVSDVQGVRLLILLARFFLPPEDSTPHLLGGRGSGVVKEGPAPGPPPRRRARVPRTPVPTVHPPSAGTQSSSAIAGGMEVRDLAYPLSLPHFAPEIF